MGSPTGGSPGCPDVEGARVADDGEPASELGGWQAPILTPRLPFSCSHEVSSSHPIPIGSAFWGPSPSLPPGAFGQEGGMWLVPCNLPALVSVCP